MCFFRCLSLSGAMIEGAAMHGVALVSGLECACMQPHDMNVSLV